MNANLVLLAGVGLLLWLLGKGKGLAKTVEGKTYDWLTNPGALRKATASGSWSTWSSLGADAQLSLRRLVGLGGQEDFVEGLRKKYDDAIAAGNVGLAEQLAKQFPEILTYRSGGK